MLFCLNFLPISKRYFHVTTWLSSASWTPPVRGTSPTTSIWAGGAFTSGNCTHVIVTYTYTWVYLLPILYHHPSYVSLLRFNKIVLKASLTVWCPIITHCSHYAHNKAILMVKHFCCTFLFSLKNYFPLHSFCAFWKSSKKV